MAAKTSWHRYGTKLRHGHPEGNSMGKRSVGSVAADNAAGMA